MNAIGASTAQQISRRAIVERANRRAIVERVDHRAFFGVSALLFVASAAVTIAWCASMSSMGGMQMPGGWTMSMAWMRMPGQTWPGMAASFMGMWVVMMVAMMLPCLVPMLWRYRQTVGGTCAPGRGAAGTTRGGSAGARLGDAGDMRRVSAGDTRMGSLTALVGVGYFSVWALFGIAAFPLGVAAAEITMQQPALSRAVPMAIGAVVLIAGLLQFTAWKARALVCCRQVPGAGRALRADSSTAWRHGLRLGLHCARCCGALMVVLLVIGVMDLRSMAAVGAAITIERLAPAGERVARVIGAVIVAAGLILIARAVAATP